MSATHTIDDLIRPGSNCRDCDEDCFWTKTEKGKGMLVNTMPVDDGNIRLEDQGEFDRWGRPVPTAIYDRTFSLLSDDNRRYISHFSTCPGAEKRRKK